jgi:hypothetical protein
MGSLVATGHLLRQQNMAPTPTLRGPIDVCKNKIRKRFAIENFRASADAADADSCGVGDRRLVH